MKNIFKLFSIIAIVTLIAFSFSACEEVDPGDDGVQKTLVITGIPVTALPTNSNTPPTTQDITGKKITVALCNNGKDKNKKADFSLYAYNQVTSNATVTIPLISYTTGVQFTGTGDFYIILYFDVSDPSSLDDDVTYAYSGGGLIAIPYNITAATTNIAFDKFTLLLN